MYIPNPILLFFFQDTKEDNTSHCSFNLWLDLPKLGVGRSDFSHPLAGFTNTLHDTLAFFSLLQQPWKPRQHTKMRNLLQPSPWKITWSRAPTHTAPLHPCYIHATSMLRPCYIHATSMLHPCWICSLSKKCMFTVSRHWDLEVYCYHSIISPTLKNL